MFGKNKAYDITEKIVFPIGITVIGNGALLQSTYSNPNNEVHYAFLLNLW